MRKLRRDRKQGTFEDLKEVRPDEAQDAKLVVMKDEAGQVTALGC